MIFWRRANMYTCLWYLGDNQLLIFIWGCFLCVGIDTIFLWKCHYLMGFYRSIHTYCDRIPSRDNVTFIDVSPYSSWFCIRRIIQKNEWKEKKQENCLSNLDQFSLEALKLRVKSASIFVTIAVKYFFLVSRLPWSAKMWQTH